MAEQTLLDKLAASLAKYDAAVDRYADPADAANEGVGLAASVAEYLASMCGAEQPCQCADLRAALARVEAERARLNSEIQDASIILRRAVIYDYDISDSLTQMAEQAAVDRMAFQKQYNELREKLVCAEARCRQLEDALRAIHTSTRGDEKGEMAALPATPSTPVLPKAIREAIEKEAIALDRLYGRIPPGSRMSDCVEAFERIAILVQTLRGTHG
jgi:hypothetical protein